MGTKFKVGDICIARDVKSFSVPTEFEGCRCRILRLNSDETYMVDFLEGNFRDKSGWTLLPRQLEHAAPQKPLATQVGGSHYTRMAIQPLEFIMANDIPYPEANIIKYVCRHRHKNGIQDLKKAQDYLNKLIAHEESKEKSNG